MISGTGNKLGKYELQAEIGRGGMGIVYRGYDTALHRAVAIKVLPQQLTYDAGFVRRFQQEAILAASLRHPNIVTIHDVGEQSGVYYIVMEYLEGTTLESWIARHGSPSAEQASRILRQVADALDFAHARGVVHRDVKPANIMISPDGRATLMDFGLVRAAEGTHLTRSGTILGTPEYMSPEQALGQPMDGRSDIYSLGVVLYKMLAGKPPFSGTSPIGITHAHVYDPPPILRLARPDLPPAIDAVIDRALAKRPADRYPNAGQLAGDFAAVFSGHRPAVAGREEGALRSVPRWLPWLAGIIGFLAVASVAMALLLGRGQGAAPTIVVTPSPLLTPTPQARGGVSTREGASPDGSAGTSVAEAPRTIPAPTLTPPGSNPSPTGSGRAVESPAPAPTAALTPAPPAPVVRAVSGAVNARSGPGTAYPVLAQAQPGETYQVVGRNTETSWWQICCVEGKAAWVAADVVEASGIGPGIPVISAPPPPVPTATLTPPRVVVPPPSTPRPPAACTSSAGSTFARVWDRDRMGCPRGAESSIWSAHESFERGWMLWRQDNDGHYALFNGGAYVAYWYPPAEPPDFACLDAQVLGRPQRGFSRVWCENPAVRQRIGNAQNDEAGDSRPLQEFENGFMIFVKERGTIAAVYADGTWTEQR